MAPSLSPIKKPVFSQLLSAIRSREDLKDRIKHIESIPSKKARFEDWPTSLSPELISVLKKSGIESLWTHQAQAVNAYEKIKNVA